jgi:UDP-N-acetylmuramate dehydrogenase
VLFTKDFEGLIIQPLVPDITVLDDTNDSLMVRAGAGVNWDTFVEWCVIRGVYGIENLSFIPGSVGAAPIQNIGAYGVEVKDTIIKVEGVNMDSKKPFELINADCEFGYRDSIFKNKLKGKVIINNVVFRLSKTPNLITNYGNLEEEIGKLGEKTLQSVRTAVINIRKKKLPDPAILGNAGSFFKNPIVSKSTYNSILTKNNTVPSYPLSDEFVKIPAGWLIEQCGWKGKQIGNCGVHKDQALVIVNYGNASGSEIINLATQIQDSVKNEFGIELELEVNVI